MRYDSPLRYPGGKALLAPLLADIMRINGLTHCSYYEPFAGGAGAALRLLREGLVSELHLNDLDVRITAFWASLLAEPQRFAETIRSIPLTITEWRRQSRICRAADLSDSFALGFSTFYLNRCNRSGVVLGSAPIGGYEQTGAWRLDARFNRESLADRVLAIAKRRDQIHLTNLDGERFLSDVLPRGNARRAVFVYVDPPYYHNSNRLYLSSYDRRDHRRLAIYLRRQKALHWVLSYDDTDFIRRLYSKCSLWRQSVHYSLQRKHRAEELIITPHYVRMPDSKKTLTAVDSQSTAETEGP